MTIPLSTTPPPSSSKHAPSTPANSMSTPTSSPTRETYLFGTAIGASLSPVFHNACYAARRVPWRLRRLDSTDMSHFLTLVSASDFGGSAVTMPHKSAILSQRHAVTHIDDEARLIGAANTLYHHTTSDGQKQLRATNTDVDGIRDSILAAIAPHHPRPQRGVVDKGSVGVVVGGGGTTRTAVYTLRFHLGCDSIYIINRLDSEVDAIINDFQAQGVENIHQLHTPSQVDELNLHPRFIVNAIPSFDPQTDGEKLARATISHLLQRPRAHSEGQRGVVLEMCYFPHTWTTICQIAKDNNWSVVQGMECMYRQAVAQQILWLGQPEDGLDLLEVGRKAAELEMERRKLGEAPN
ncbi:hypothetical protein ACQY0O_007829 [Thecaphora frezii]